MLHSNILKDLQWIRDQLNSTKEEVRELTAVLYGLILSYSTNDTEFESAINYLISQTSSKFLEAQHGALLAIGNCLEIKIITKQADNSDLKNWATLKSSIDALGTCTVIIVFLILTKFIPVPFLKHQNPMLASAASSSVGLLGRVCALPLENGKPVKNGSPDAKKHASNSVTKFYIVTQLLDVMNNVKLSAKMREKAAKSLGLLCVGEKFPHTKEVIKGLLRTAKEVGGRIMFCDMTSSKLYESFR